MAGANQRCSAASSGLVTGELSKVVLSPLDWRKYVEFWIEGRTARLTRSSVSETCTTDGRQVRSQHFRVRLPSSKTIFFPAAIARSPDRSAERRYPDRAA